MKRNLPILAILLLSLVCTVAGQNPAPPDPSAPAAQTAMQKWLADLDATWQAVFKRDVNDPFTAENDKLRGQYLAAIEAGVSKASGAGDLNAAIAWRTEQKRFAEANAIPAQDDAADLPPVKQLRAAWRSQLVRMEKDRAARAKALQAKYDQALAQAQTQLTKANRLDDALLVKSKRDEVAAAWLAGIAAAPPPVATGVQKPPAKIASNPPAGKAAAKMDDRAMVKKLREMGCLCNTSERPGGKFEFAGVTFANKDWTVDDFAIFDQLERISYLGIIGNSATDAMIERARVCSKLKTLFLMNLPNVTGTGVQVLTRLPELNAVTLIRVPIDDAGFKGSFEKSKVETLELGEVGITDASLATMGGMQSLQTVGFQNCSGFTAAGWQGLGRARQLKNLKLLRTHPGPDGFAHLAKTRTLESLEFVFSPPTEEELQVIRTMQQLRKITVQGATLPDGAVAALKAALPKAIIKVNGKNQ